MADIRASIGLDSKEAVAAIDALSKRVDTLIAQLSKGATINVDASTAKAEASVRGAKGRLESALGKGLGVKVDANTKPAVDAIRNSKGQFEKAGREAGTAASSGLSDTFKGALGGSLLGGGLAGIVSTGVSALTSMASAAFDEYRALNANIQNIGTLGVEAAGLDLQRFEGLINELSTTVPDSASNIANGVYNAISAGITGTEEEIVGFVETASRVAVAGLSDTNAAVNGLTSVVNAYGTGAQGAEEASNVFFATIKAGKTSFNELNAGLANVIPAASAANVSFTEVGASIAKLTTVGIPTAQATTQIRAALIELQKPAKPLEQALTKAFGSPQAAVEKLKAGVEDGGGLIATLQQLQESAASSGQSLTQIFGSAEAASAALSLTGKNAESARAILQGVQADVNAGVADKAFEAASKGLDVQINIFKNKIQGVFNDIFRTIVPIVQNVIGILQRSLGPTLSRLGDTFGDAFSRISKVMKPVLAVIGGIIITNIVLAVEKAIAIMTGLARVVTNVFDSIKVAVQPIIDSFSDLFGTLDGGTDPMELFTEALEIMGTIMQETALVVADLAGLVIDVLLSAFQIVGRAIASVVNLFKSQGSETKNVAEQTKKAVPIVDQLKRVFDNIRGTIVGVTFALRTVKEAVGDFVGALATFNLDGLGAAFANIGGRVAEAYDAGFNSIQRQRAEQEAAAAAAEAKRQEEEAAAEAAADASDSTKAQKTALEQALNAYKKIEASQKSQVAAKLKELELNSALTEEERERQSEIIKSDSARLLQNRAREIFQATTNEFGLFVSTLIKTAADETVDPIRDVFTGLAFQVTPEVRISRTDVVRRFTPLVPLIEREIKPIEIPVEVPSRVEGVLKTSLNSIAQAIGPAVAAAFNFTPKVDREALAGEVANLKAQLKEGEISYAEYANKVDGINSQMKNSPNRLDLIFQGINAGIVKAMASVVSEVQKSMDELSAKVADGTLTISDSFELLAVSAASSFISMVADGQNALKALVVGALDALQALVPVFVAQITGINLAAPDNIATFGAAGVARAALFTALLQSLVAAARAAVSGAFATGGLVTGGERIIRVNERGPEYVINAKATQRYLPLLEAINTGKPLRSDLRRGLNLDNLGITFHDQAAKGLAVAEVVGGDRHGRAILSELKAMRKDNEALRSEIAALRNNQQSTHRTEITIPIDERAMERRHAKRQLEYATKW